MAATATRRYTGQGLKPAMLPKKASQDAARLRPGAYVAGQMLGKVTVLTGADDVQTMTVTGVPTGGSFIVDFNGDPIGPIAWNAAIAAVQALFDAAPQIGPGQTVVAGGPFPGSAMTVTFSGSLMSALWQPLITLKSNSLTGGTAPTAAIVHTTPGRSVGGMFAKYDDTQSDGTDIARAILANAARVDTYGRIFGPGPEFFGSSYSAAVWISGSFRTMDLTGLDANAIADLNARLLYGTTADFANPGTILVIP